MVEKFVLDGQQARLTQASLETLAVDRLPPAGLRGRGSARSAASTSTASSAPWSPAASIEEVGADEESGAILYGTTPYFLQRLGLRQLDDLPALAPYLPEVDVLDELAEQGRA